MSNEQRLRAVERTADSGSGDATGGELDSTRAEAQRIIAAATGAFERIRATNSQEFLSRSRQTGGQ